MGAAEAWIGSPPPDVLPRLLDIWMHSDDPEMQDKANWAICASPIVDRSSKPLGDADSEVVRFITEQEALARGGRSVRYPGEAALIVGFYLGSPWSDEELADGVALSFRSSFPAARRRRDAILAALGPPGERKLKALKRDKKRK